MGYVDLSGEGNTPSKGILEDIATEGEATTTGGVTVGDVSDMAPLKQYLLAQILSSFGGQTAPYSKIGQSSDVSNVNPFTSMFMRLLTGGGLPTGSAPGRPRTPGSGKGTGVFGASSAMPGTEMGGGLLGQFANEALGGVGSQTAGYRSALDALVAGDRSNPFAFEGLSAADLAGRGAIKDVSKMYSTKNALYSGAAVDTATRAASEARTNTMLPYMQTFGNMAQQSQQQGQGMLSTILGLGGALSGQEYYSPSYVQNPNYVSPLQGYGIEQGVQTNQLQAILGGMSGVGNMAATLMGGK